MGEALVTLRVPKELKEKVRRSKIDLRVGKVSAGFAMEHKAGCMIFQADSACKTAPILTRFETGKADNPMIY